MVWLPVFTSSMNSWPAGWSATSESSTGAGGGAAASTGASTDASWWDASIRSGGPAAAHPTSPKLATRYRTPDLVPQRTGCQQAQTTWGKVATTFKEPVVSE